MSKLNRDVLYLIFEELQDDINTLYSCISINKTWCETIIPILWRNPLKYDLKNKKKKFLLNIIISHLPDELKKNLKKSLKNKKIDFFTNSYQRLLFDYISFCKHLNLIIIQRMICIEYKMKRIIMNEVVNLFINGNTKFTHLYIPQEFDYQIHLISGAKNCFSAIEFLSCSTCINNNILIGLAEICRSIKNLRIVIVFKKNNNHEIVRLIEAQRKLFDIDLSYDFYTLDETLKNSLMNLSLPYLQILKVKGVPIRVLIGLIENTSGSLIEVQLYYEDRDDINNERIIQAIYQNCPNLKHLQVMLLNSNILELEKLLIKCQYLNVLYLICLTPNNSDWDNLFEVLVRSSPTNLFKFKFSCSISILESLKLFFDNWNGRHPMLLQLDQMRNVIRSSRYPMLLQLDQMRSVEDLEEKYKAKGMVKKFKINFFNFFGELNERTFFF